MADADRERILRLAEAVADRAAVDWERESERTDERLRSRIRNLRVVQQIDRVHSDTSETETTELEPMPSSWGPLKILSRIDAGGFGQVFRARDEALEAEVALKLLRRVPEGQDPHDERFLGEARKLARVRHPNVLLVHGVAVHDGVVGLWTELLEGVTLERRLETEGPFGANEAALVGIDLCRALSAVHGAGIVHRDVKTKNVMREKGGRIVLLDFSAGSDRHASSSSPVGTPLYMAPELFEGKDSGTAQDLYSLGVLLYRIVSARYPVDARDMRELERKHREGAPRTPLVDVRPDLPAGFVRIVERALDRDPERRYASAGEMERDLAAFVGSAPGKEPDGDHIKVPRGVAFAVAGLLVVAAVAAVWTWLGTDSPFRVDAGWLRTGAGAPETLDAGSTISPGDCLRLRIDINRPAHVYVLNEDANGATAVLFPLSSLDLANPLPGGKKYELPGTVAGREECWTVGGGGGEETLLVIASLEPFTEFEQEIAGLPRIDGSAAAPIPQGSWGKRFRGVVGLSSVDEAGPKLSDLAKVLTGEIAKKAGLWTEKFSFKTTEPGSDAATESESPLSEIERQERDLLDAPEDPVRLTALARSLLRLADTPENLADQARALELSSQAVELDPKSIDACETRAVALERVFLREPALEAWRHCLDLGGDEAFEERAQIRMKRLGAPRPEPPWKAGEPRLRAAFARGNTEELVEVAKTCPEPSTALVEDELLAAWADEYHKDPIGGGARALSGLEAIARGVHEATGDKWLDAIVQPIKQAAAAGDGARLAKLADAHRDCSAARVARRAGDRPGAAELARGAAAAFREAGSPYELRAEYEVAVCDYHEGRLEEAGRSFVESVEKAREIGGLVLLGELQWMQGMVRTRQGRFGDSTTHYHESAATFESLGFTTRLASVSVLLATDDDLIGSHRLAWASRHSVLEDIDRFDDSRKQYQTWLATGFSAFTQGLPRVAVEFERVGLAVASLRGDGVEIVTAAARLASFLRCTGHGEQAVTAIADAKAWLAANPGSSRPELEALVAAAQAELVLEQNPSAALPEVDRAIGYYERGQQFRLAQLYAFRGRVRRETGDFESAESDLARGIAMFEQSRSVVGTDEASIALGDVSRAVYDEMISFQEEIRESPETALKYAERGRARLLRAQLDLDDLPSPHEWTSRTPPAVAWVYYVLLDNRLLIWVGRHEALHHIAEKVDADALALKIGNLRYSLELGNSEQRVTTSLRSLHDLLIAPIQSSLAGAQTVVVLPDKVLNLVPFAALIDRRTGRYLAEDYAIGVAAAATSLWVPSPVGSEGSERQLGSALVVGNPTSRGAADSALGDLPDAEDEARIVARVYAKSRLLIREDASLSSFLREFGRYDVVHFAGHAIVSQRDPSLSRLVFASDPALDINGDLFARDISDLDAGATRLVVLAACATSGRNVSSSEGTIGLARPFLAIGVPNVIGTLWRLDDVAGAELFSAFHKAVGGGVEPTTALNTAQRAMIRAASGKPAPQSWAAAQLYVGNLAGSRRAYSSKSARLAGMGSALLPKAAKGENE